MRLCLTTLSIFFSTLTFSQQLDLQSKDWKLFFENDKVKFYSRPTDCINDQEGIAAQYILLKAVNLTNAALEVSFYTDIYYNGKCVNCDHQMGDTQRRIKLAAGQAVVGDCRIGASNGMRIFSRWLNMTNTRILTRAEVTEIKIHDLH